MRTLTVKQNGYMLEEGWQVTTISRAEYGNWNGTKYIDVYFEDLPPTLNLRVYETFNRETGEEFALGNPFRFANAGIERVEIHGNGSRMVVIKDNPEVLVGKKLSLYLYQDDSTYFRILPRIAPGEIFDNSLESICDKHIAYYRAKAEGYYNTFVRTRSKDTVESTPF